MCDNQLIQSGKFDISIFQNDPRCSLMDNGFNWEETKEGFDYWSNILNGK